MHATGATISCQGTKVRHERIGMRSPRRWHKAQRQPGERHRHVCPRLLTAIPTPRSSLVSLDDHAPRRMDMQQQRARSGVGIGDILTQRMQDTAVSDARISSFCIAPAARYAVVYVSRRLSRCSCRPRASCLCRLGRHTLSCARIAFPPVARCSLRGRLVASPSCDESLFSAVFDARISSIRLSSTWTVTSQIYFLARIGFSCLCASLAYSFSLCQRPLLRGYASCMRHDAIDRDI